MQQDNFWTILDSNGGWETVKRKYKEGTLDSKVVELLYDKTVITENVLALFDIAMKYATDQVSVVELTLELFDYLDWCYEKGDFRSLWVAMSTTGRLYNVIIDYFVLSVKEGRLRLSQVIDIALIGYDSTTFVLTGLVIELFEEGLLTYDDLEPLFETRKGIQLVNALNIYLGDYSEVCETTDVANTFDVVPVIQAALYKGYKYTSTILDILIDCGMRCEDVWFLAYQFIGLDEYPNIRPRYVRTLARVILEKCSDVSPEGIIGNLPRVLKELTK